MRGAPEFNHAYVTAFHAVYEPMSGLLRYVDAGHGHARLLRGATGQETLPLRSAPIGIFPDTQFVVGTATLNRGDALVVFSDGLLDLRPDLATKDVPLPYESRRAGSAQEPVGILVPGSKGREPVSDLSVLPRTRI